jgi:hypothetical protein
MSSVPTVIVGPFKLFGMRLEILTNLFLLFPENKYPSGKRVLIRYAIKLL